MRRSFRSEWLGLFQAVATILLLFGFGSTASAQEPSPAATPAVPGAGHPAHIHAGSCDALGEVIYPLADVSEPASGPTKAIPVGLSVTTISATLNELLSSSYAINVHESLAAIDKYVACGNLDGAPTGKDLFVGIKELNSSGEAGIAWLHQNEDDSTTVSLFLAHGLSMATPEATEPPANG